jgi:hypothetical protein
MITMDMQMPGGAGKMHMEMNPADGKIVILMGDQRQEQALPDVAKSFLVNGMTVVVDDRGQVKELKLPPEAQQALQGLGLGGADLTGLSKLAAWVEPMLPEGPVKVGDTWEAKIPLQLLLGGAQAPEAATRFTYGGEADIDGVKCHKINAEISITGMTMKMPVPAAGGMTTEMSNFSVAVNMTQFLSQADTHLVLGQGTLQESGTVHVKGTIDQNGQKVDVDQTVNLDGINATIEMKRE